MTFLVYIRKSIRHGSPVQGKQDLKTKFLLTKKIKNKVSSNKR